MTNIRSEEMEKRSAAVTLSDMEMFIFPELLYSLVLANIMSPCIWKWLDDPWFAGIDRMKPVRRITRVKQYIMDHYAFNLDLDTWGLTTTEKEIDRFKAFIDESTLSRSNALFGYEGDQYYFDMDIRTHFGLDKYSGNVIPYWKTETVEAMNAFAYKPDYNSGAGECVSLAALYAAALFVVARIPLKDIYLMATPLHSQNFIDVNGGILTNNRRLVTKNMWFNGTALSAQARRALENERITIVAHKTGYIHTIYDNASIDPDVFEHFSHSITSYLQTSLSPELLGNFIRHHNSMQKCFQIRKVINGKNHYISIENVMAYEHNSPYMITDNTRDKLLNEIDIEEFCVCPLKSRIILNDLEEFIDTNKIDIVNDTDIKKLKTAFTSSCLSAEIAIESLLRFCRTNPKLPDIKNKEYVPYNTRLNIDMEMKREEIIEYLDSIRTANPMADMAFFAYRDLAKTNATPFLIAAIERNPVSVEATTSLTINEIIRMIHDMTDESIYEGVSRLAQPDEVWNSQHGDGLEKAILLANILRAKDQDMAITITVKSDIAVVKYGNDVHEFNSSKQIPDQEWILQEILK